MKTTNSATANYDGMGKEGKGHIGTQSGALDAPYGFGTRFEGKPGTNPEELIAAAHAACFTMALSFKLAEAGFEDGKIDTEAKVTLERQGDWFAVTKSALTTKTTIAGIEKARFDELAADAKANCPISKLLDCEITLAAELVSE